MLKVVNAKKNQLRGRMFVSNLFVYLVAFGNIMWK